jgi:hypothetical protein
MKNKNLLSIILSTLVIVAMAFVVSCEGPEGPMGATGENGTNGVDGLNGIDGVDGLDGGTSCAECHDLSTDLYAKIQQYNVSTHAVGGNFERNGGSCAICHTHEGFLDNLITGAGSSDAAAVNPTRVNCRTCHKIHETYDVSDYDLRVVGPVTLMNNGMQVVDLGAANMCASCHQSRSISPVPVPGGADVEVTSIRYGPHHGPQSNMLMGYDMVEIPGSESYPTSNPHTNVEGACIGCHMSDPYGIQAGGHTWNMTYEYHGAAAIWDAGCVGCHTSPDFHDDLEAFEDEINVMLEDIRILLEAQGVLDADGYAVPGIMAADLAGSLLNYRYVALEDRSVGIHNPFYVKALLTNTLEYLQTL